jgi:DNA-3-methyladenine glycosylase II
MKPSSPRIHIFDESNFAGSCRKLASADPALKQILQQYGPPPMWTRPARFSTLVLTILEQQVSLASAMAAYKKLREKIGLVTAPKLLQLSDEELRECYFSRQKILYSRLLAEAIVNRELVLAELPHCSDEEVHKRLTRYKGIGDWTADIYMIHALRRADRFPIGDIALVNSMRERLLLPTSMPKEGLLHLAESWRPFRTIAAMILWHGYIQKRKMKIEL